MVEVLLTPPSFYRYWGFLYIGANSNDSQKELVRRSIDLGADINIRDFDGKSPLWWTYYNRDYQSIQLLIEAGVNQ